MKNLTDINAVIAHYDLLIDEGNDPFRDPPELQEYMDKWDGESFLQNLQLAHDKNVLEIGVGTGRIAAKTAKLCKRLTGIDVSPKTIVRARENLKDYANISFVCADFLSFDFPETFDVVYSSLTMMHFENKQRVISKVGSLLIPGGIFCISIDKDQSGYIDMGSRCLKVYPDTPENIAALMNISDMTVVHMSETEHAHIIVGIKKARPR